MTTEFGIRALSERTGVSAHTLRYYEASGLMLTVKRDPANRRVFGDDHVRWVHFLRRLRSAGMGIEQLRRYAELTRSTSVEAPAHRLDMLRAHRDEVRARIDELQRHLEIIEQKVARGCQPEDAPSGGSHD